MLFSFKGAAAGGMETLVFSFLIERRCFCIWSSPRIVRISPHTTPPPTDMSYGCTRWHPFLMTEETYTRFVEKYKDYFFEIFTEVKIGMDFILIFCFCFCYCSPSFFFPSLFFLNRLHSCLCPPVLQCARWHSLLQYCTVWQPMHW